GAAGVVDFPRVIGGGIPGFVSGVQRAGAGAGGNRAADEDLSGDGTLAAQGGAGIDGDIAGAGGAAGGIGDAESAGADERWSAVAVSRGERPAAALEFGEAAGAEGDDA